VGSGAYSGIGLLEQGPGTYAATSPYAKGERP
jgi:hypothetical protein